MATDPNGAKNYPMDLPDEPPPPYPGLSSSDGAPLPQLDLHAGPPAYPPPASDALAYHATPNPYTGFEHGYYPAWKSREGSQGYPLREYVAPPLVITSQPLQSSTVLLSHNRQPSNYLALSIVTCLCFSPLCGLIAICFSVMSQNSYIEGDMEGASKNGKVALAMCIIGIFFSTIIIIVMFSSGQNYFPT